MKILVAGATGALGKQLVPRLAGGGHDVFGMTRTPSKQDAVRQLGGKPVVADALDPHPAGAMRETLDAFRHLEQAVVGADWTVGIVLRYGGFYGPGTSFAADGAMLEMVRRRKFPVVGNGQGVWSFVHIEDAADATALAIERGRRGIYNVVDDDPAPVAEWLPAAAAAAGGKPPWHVPRWLGRVLAGEAAAVMMTEVRGASNEKAKRELGWKPAHSSWREGFAEAVAG